LELIVEICIIDLLIANLLPTITRARESSNTDKCQANLRSLALAQTLYAGAQQNLLVVSGDGSFDVQGSWIGILEPYAGHALVRRCPSDNSVYFDAPYTDMGGSVLRMTSYGINNYVSPTHAPLGTSPPKRISQIPRSSAVIQFVELAESGSYAVADHLHVQEFYSPISPEQTVARMNKQMPIGRHGGGREKPGGLLNYAFLDGHAETLPAGEVYSTPYKNKFIPGAIW
jgi:prepilin-type processing-associated H-X9-DG protein